MKGFSRSSEFWFNIPPSENAGIWPWNTTSI
jgi:hypothetical protein